jgi:(p)ppGpp synthase/HD superfamily hydrolase
VVEDDAILRVALADKVHNARSLVRDYREEGQALWARFQHRSAREQLWYYRAWWSSSSGDDRVR